MTKSYVKCKCLKQSNLMIDRCQTLKDSNKAETAGLKGITTPPHRRLQVTIIKASLLFSDTNVHITDLRGG